MVTNKYIQTDYNDGIALLRASVFNALQSLDNGSINEMKYEYMAHTLVLDCIVRLDCRITEVKHDGFDGYYKVVTENNNIIEFKADKLKNLITLTRKDKKDNHDS